MLLHHFTSRDSLQSIRRSGLSRGSVPSAPGRDLKAVWLTADSGLSGHGLESGGAVMTDQQRWQAKDWSGAEPPAGSRFPKEASVRITVDVEEDDPNLHGWLEWARQELPPQILSILHPPGTHRLHQARSWYLYFGTILPEAFVGVEETANLRSAPAIGVESTFDQSAARPLSAVSRNQ